MKNNLFLILLLIFIGCQKVDRGIKDKIDADYRIDHLSMASTYKKKPNWNFSGEDIIIKKDTISGKNCRIVMNNRSGRSTIIGRQGEMIVDKNMKLKGNVIYDDRDYKLVCEYLDYDIKSDKLTVPNTFQFYIKKENKKIEGKKLTSEENFIKIYIEEVDRMRFEVNNKALKNE